MATFEDFIKDFDLTDGTRITASRISDSQKNGKNNISGVVSFYFQSEQVPVLQNKRKQPRRNKWQLLKIL